MSTKILASKRFVKLGMTLSFEFKAADMWIGFYLGGVNPGPIFDTRNLWICLIPCFPIHVSWYVLGSNV